MTDTKWIAALSVGDEVGVGGSGRHMARVVSRTAAYVTLDDGDRYRVTTGRQVGWSSTMSGPPWLEPADAMRRQLALDRLEHDRRWCRTATTDQLVRMVAILDEVTP